MKRWVWRIAGGLAVVAILIAVTGVLVIRSQWFFDYVRTRIIEEARRATGAQVEMAGFSFDWKTMRARVDGFVLHGKEGPNDAPLVRVASATLGLKVISLFEQSVDLQSLRVEKPEANIIIFPDGTNNFPGPESAQHKLWSDQLVNLKIGSYEVTNGMLIFDHRGLPFEVRGENLMIKMDYDAANPSYHGEFSSDGVNVAPLGYAPMRSSVATKFVLERNRLQLSDSLVRWGANTAELHGVLEDMRKPHGTVTVKADGRVSDVVREFRLPFEPAGTANFNGTLDVSFEDGFDYRVRGDFAGRGLRVVANQVKVADADLRANVDLSDAGAILRKVTAHAQGTTILGEAQFTDWKKFHFAGTVTDVNLRRVVAMATTKAAPWNGTLSGPVDLSFTTRQPDLKASAQLSIVPAADGDPLEGHVELAYDQAGNTIELGSSSVSTPSTRLEVQGTLGKTLRVRARTTQLDDVLPVIEFLQGERPESPLKLNNGSASVDGILTGSIDDPQFRGQIAVANGEVRQFAFDRFASDIEANKREVQTRNITAARGKSTVTGSASLLARGTDLSNPNITAQLSFRNIDVAEVAREAGSTEPLTGLGTATARITGTLEQPEATLQVDVQSPTAFGEKVDRLRANVHYVGDAVQVTDGIVNDAGAELRFNGGYKRLNGSWRSGELSFDASTTGLPFSRLERLTASVPNLAGTLSGRVQGSGTINGSAFTLTSADGNAALRQMIVDGQAVGNATLTAQTRGTDLTVSASGTVRESRVEATGAWKLDSDSPGSATVRFTRLSVASLQDLVMLDRRTGPPSVEGFVEGDATINMALRKPRDFKAEVRLANVQVNPRQNPAPRLNLKPEDVVLRSSGPVVVEVTEQVATVRTARFTGRNTQMDLSGTVPIDSTAGADLNVRGNIDLIILQLLRPDLQAEGSANVNASIRGSLKDPNVSGQLVLAGARLYLGDLPQGVDNAAGTILFDRRRATIQQLTAVTGGGQVGFTGFLEFGDVLVYRLQAQARNVRVRYPQDVSTSFDANLALTGTSDASTLSGTITLNRTAFNITADLGQVLAEAAQSSSVGETENEYLSGMQLDLKIQNGSNFQLETQLATDIEADVDLRVRGTPSRPGVTGSVAINRGQMQVFGNRYNVERGDIRFLNPLKIEPRFDMDLSTRARGVTVNVSFSGTMQRFNVNYSSDPPLQSSEIIALLAVGRDPTQISSQTTTPTAANASSNFAQAGGSLLGQAASAQMSNISRRFFGGSRVKIDPTLTGVDNLPQARLQFEQQVSKDITLTYITNLNRAQEQIVRVQWDISRTWSAIAVRDTNGLFGVDFQFRKRFK